MGRLDGKVAFITGGARGQGLEAGRIFAREGARVVLADVLDAEGKDAAGSIGDAANFVHLDVANEEDWRTAISDSEQRFGDATVLLNMAGILKFGTIAEMPLAEYMSVINVNQVGVFLGMRAVFEGMKRAGGGSIINVSSVEGLRGSVGLAAYTASKFAVRGMTKVAAGEFGKYDIRVNSVHPGVIDTPMLRAQTGDVDLNKVFKRGVPLRRAGTAADVANLCLFLASDESSYCSGAEFVVDGGATSFVGWGGPVPRPD
ncbi:MAG: glucose 1-dehydrogenase [Actinomycetota bacterium]